MTEAPGYRHGSRERTLTTSLGPATIPMPRARIQAADGTTAEWRSAPVTRYQRRTVRVDEMILGVYLAGTNTRRIKGALACCGMGPSRKMPYRGSWVGCARTSTRGAVAPWPTRTFATCSWMGGIPRCGSAVDARGCRC